MVMSDVSGCLDGPEHKCSKNCVANYQRADTNLKKPFFLWLLSKFKYYFLSSDLRKNKLDDVSVKPFYKRFALWYSGRCTLILQKITGSWAYATSLQTWFMNFVTSLIRRLSVFIRHDPSVLFVHLIIHVSHYAMLNMLTFLHRNHLLQWRGTAKILRGWDE